MRARKRVVTSGAMRKPDAKRGPAVRPTRPAIVSPRRPAGTPGATRPGPASMSRGLQPDGGSGSGEERTIDLSVDLGRGLMLRNPIIVASGPFGYGVEHADAVDLERLGAICTRGITLGARVGNRAPRMAEVPAGLLSSVGLQGPGIAGVLDRYGPAWRALGTALIVNVCGESAADYVAVVRMLDGVPGIGGVELNLSCPNASRGGLQFALDADAAGALTAAVRRATDLPILVKLSPNASDVRAIARAAEEAGADGLTAINTLAGLAVAPERDRPFLGATYGGISGAAIRPVAQRVVFEVAQAVEIPVVAAGGVATLDDVLDFLALGAVAVQVGTAAFGDPQLPGRLADGLEDECRRRGLMTPASLVGTALPARMTPPSSRGVEYRP
jgi:dihydroorotate dehydrogenase (NAD+) catalytic subunit